MSLSIPSLLVIQLTPPITLLNGLPAHSITLLPTDFMPLIALSLALLKPSPIRLGRFLAPPTILSNHFLTLVHNPLAKFATLVLIFFHPLTIPFLVLVTILDNPVRIFVNVLRTPFHKLDATDLILFSIKFQILTIVFLVFVVIDFRVLNNFVNIDLTLFHKLVAIDLTLLSIAVQILAIVLFIDVLIDLIMLSIFVKPDFTALNTPVTDLVNMPVTLVHIPLNKDVKDLTNVPAIFRIFPTNCSCIKFHKNLTAPENICCTPSHIFEKSPVNRPLNTLTTPIITSRAPVIMPLILPHTVLITNCTAFIAIPIIGEITVSNAHLTLSTIQVKIGLTNSQIY